MVQYCVVPLCKSNAFSPGVSFFSFPKDDLLKKQWILKIRRDEKRNVQISSTMRVCSRHFLPEDIIPSKSGLRKLLRKGAIPSVFDFTTPKSICWLKGSTLNPESSLFHSSEESSESNVDSAENPESLLFHPSEVSSEINDDSAEGDPKALELQLRAWEEIKLYLENELKAKCQEIIKLKEERDEFEQITAKQARELADLKLKVEKLHSIHANRQSALKVSEDFPAVKDSLLDNAGEIFISKHIPGFNSDKSEIQNAFLQTEIAGQNGLKRRILKKNAVPSLNLPVSPEYTDDVESNTKLKKIKKSKSNNKVRVSERMIPQKRRHIYFSKTNSQDSDDQVKIKHKTFSSLFDDIRKERIMSTSSCIKQLHEIENTEDKEHEINKTILPISINSDQEIYEEQMDVAPCISRLCVKADDYLLNDANVTEPSSDNLEDGAQIAASPPTQLKSEFDYSIFKSSPDDSKETLTEKLDSMISINELLQKKLKFYKNKCKMYEKEVNIMKGVIDNLKLINSVTFDN